jgi:metal-responsive CopG/Arc/MetJ family transcriptional regulator
MKHSPRTHKYVFTLNDEENKALSRYIEKYKVHNRSRFIRETLITAILKKFDEDHPTLF